MKCPSEGKIQGFIDKELNDIEFKDVEKHLYQCEKCKDTYEKLISSDSFIMEKLQNYKNELNIKPTNIENMNIEVKSKKGAKKDMRKYKNIAVAASLALVLTTCVTVKPIRAAVMDAVSIFRVKDIKSVSISLEDIKNLEQALEKGTSDINIDKIGKVDFQGGEHKNITLEEAKKELPFTVLIPKNLPAQNTESISLETPVKIDFALNVENVNEILKSLGGKKVFPKTLDGKTFSLNTAGILNITYKVSTSGKYVSVTQSKVPEITAPADANVDEIFNALSELSVLPPQIQSQLKSMKDWKNTLYVPNVENNLEKLTIDGTKAVGSFKEDYSSILILKNDVLVAVSGNVDKNELIEIVKSMR